MTIKSLIKKIIPNFLLSFYHLALAYLADFIYGSPSKKLVVIGVTGTNGKSTTVNLISKILEEAGHKTALTSTVNFKIATGDLLNNRKMTMPGRFFLQRLMAKAVKIGCEFVVIESSSEGIKQHRQTGIYYDCLVFTNLTPEHLEAHGGFENYKQAKLDYFRHLEKLPAKFIAGHQIKKTIIFNMDDQYGPEFAKFKVDQVISFGKTSDVQIKGTNLQADENGIAFGVNNERFNLKLKGLFDFYNALAAIATASAFEIDLSTCKRALEKVENIPGRMELIEEGQAYKILVDYAPEPESLRQMYESVKHWPKDKTIHVLGSTGGGRDQARRKILGQIAATNADIVVVTNEDPYDDDPWEIIEGVAVGAIENGKIPNQNLFKILDRRGAIAKALSLAKEGDLVIITGKGSEQKMAVKGGYIPWDDRVVVKEELKKLL